MIPLPTGKYKTIVIDPPWPLSAPYKTMPITQIAALPIFQLTEKNAYVFLWTPNKMMEEAFAMLRAWRLTYVQTITWCKNYGLGRPPYTATEHLLMARKGQMQRSHESLTKVMLPANTVWLQEKRILNWFETTHKPKHSEKPQQAFDIVESVSPGPYLEMFARKERSGWTTWGDELI